MPIAIASTVYIKQKRDCSLCHPVSPIVATANWQFIPLFSSNKGELKIHTRPDLYPPLFSIQGSPSVQKRRSATQKG